MRVLFGKLKEIKKLKKIKTIVALSFPIGEIKVITFLVTNFICLYLLYLL